MANFDKLRRIIKEEVLKEFNRMHDDMGGDVEIPQDANLSDLNLGDL